MTRPKGLSTARFSTLMLLIAALLSVTHPLHAQNQSFAWTWEAGDQETGAVPDYGETGKTIGSRERSAMVADGAGNFWMFGGQGFIESTTSTNINYLADLWRYNPSVRTWEWVSGSKFSAPMAMSAVKGQPSIHASPGARMGHAMWVDSVDNIWIFGGLGRGAVNSGVGALNDLWKYNPNTAEWTWVSGSNTINSTGTYGSQGVPDTANTPNGREGVAYWKDAAGNFWVFGGKGTTSNGNGEMNDLWMFNPNTLEWTWVKGSSSPNVFGLYGAQGVANIANNPGSRDYSTASIDANGEIWLFGGEGEGAATSNGRLSDLWKYTPSTNRWTWVSGSNQIDGYANYGTQGAASTLNNPGARLSANSWTDSNGDFWLFGGDGFVGSGNANALNDTWKYKPSNGTWTWVKGSSTGTSGNPGSLQIEDVASTPYRARGSAGCVDSSGNFWMWRGREHLFNFWYGGILMRFDNSTDNWTWMDGPGQGNVYGIYGATVSSPIMSPGSRQGQCIWEDTLGNFYVFGGKGYDGAGREGHLNDLWRYNASSETWTFITGTTEADDLGNFGNLQTPSSFAFPAGRELAVHWVDSAGNFWLFGGQRATISNTAQHLNDLWRFSPSSGNWTWMGGSENSNVNGAYGIQGLGDVTNMPGSRVDATAWVDSSGAFVLFGGFGYGASGLAQYLNDMWRYDPANGEWTWVSGATSTNQNSNYGTIGVPSGTNIPGARQGAHSWVDTNDNVWMYGGFGFRASGSEDYLADLWRYDPQTNIWTYMKGTTTSFTFPILGTQGVAATNNRPGSAIQASTWADNAGGLWMFGGIGNSSSGQGRLSDVWKYDIATNNWTWMKGTGFHNQTGVYSTQGSFAATNNPGARVASSSIVTSDGKWFLFAGSGYATGTFGNLMDVWEYDPLTNEWVWHSGSNIENGKGLYASVEDASPGVREDAATWRTPNGDLWMFGGFGNATEGTTEYLNDLWKYDPSTRAWTFVRGWIHGDQRTANTPGMTNDIIGPGGRRASQTWVGPNGDLWLFGGYGYSEVQLGHLSDLWRYDIAADTWTYVKGDISSAFNVGVYGTQGIADSANAPGSRLYAVTWVDSSGNFWMFGGDGYGQNFGANHLNDLWKYDHNNGYWTWESGASNPNQSGSYGTQGVPSSTNVPRSRENAVGWVDNNDDLWLFGGTFGNSLNDLWHYDRSAGIWTWVDGGTTSSTVNPNYGTQGVFAASNIPGRRYGSAAWTDASGNFWLFGGRGNYLGGFQGYLNDLWVYDRSIDQWAWMKGDDVDNQIGVYGTQWVADTLNNPGSRLQPAYWEPVDSKFWMFGGYGRGSNTSQNAAPLNDLWSFVADSCNLIVSTTSVTNITCFGDSNGSVTISAMGGSGGYSYAWSTGDTTTTISGLMAGNYAITVNDSTGCQTVFSANISQPSAPLSVSISPSDVLCAGGSTGAAVAMPTGGTQPYSLLWNTAFTGANLNNISAGVYSITVTDANGCTAENDVTISEPSALTLTTTATGSSCAGSSGSASVSASGGTGIVSFLWNTNATGASISGATAGTYYVTATDVNGCTALDSVVIVNSPAVSVSATSSTTSCAGGNDGTATATASGGTGSFSYTWNNGASGNSISGLVAGTYTVTVSDGLNCTATTSVTVSSPAAVAVTVSITDVTCPGGNNGALSASATNTTGSAIYIWSNGGFGNSINGLTAGTYTVTVTDANGCSAIQTSTVTQPTAITINLTSTNDPNCFGGNDGQIEISVAGNDTYTYAWSNGSDSTIAAALSAGSYTVTVTNSAGCTNTASYTLSQPSTPVSVNIDSLTFVSCNGASDGIAIASAAGGTGTFNFSWSNGSAGNAIISLSAGAYTVTAADGNGCEATALAVITEPQALSIATSSISSSCTGSATGSVSAVASGGTSPYSYAWSNGGNSASVSGLNAGLYTVTLTDDRGCTAIDSALIGGIQVSLSAANVTCNSGIDGTASANAIGGSGSYSYLWSNGATNSQASGLSAGTYTVTISDTSGCVITDSITLTEPAAMNVFIASGDILCNGDSNGLASAVVIGGVGTKTYTWNTGSTALNINGLLAGTYTVTVTDQDACTAMADVTINEPGALVVSLTSNDVSCPGLQDGSIAASTAGGSGSLTYAWSNGEDSTAIIDLSAGIYSVTVTDSTNCFATASDTISAPAPFIDSLSATDVTCFGDSTGSATAFTTGVGMTYLWSNGGTASTISGLNSGTYSVTVTDGSSCTMVDSISIQQPSSAVVAVANSVSNVLCFGDSSGALSVTVLGGVTPFAYQWSNGATTNQISNLDTGLYGVTVTDGNGCSGHTQTTITQPSNPLSASVSTTTTLLCFGDSTGTATATALGGTGTLTYNWSNGGTTALISGLMSGTYTVTTTDANGCSTTASGSISEPSTVLTLSVSSTTNATCFGGNNGSATAVATGANGSLAFQWSSGSTAATATGLSAGNYGLTVTDSAGCQATTIAPITEPAALSISTTQTNILCTGSNTGAASASVSNGVGTVNYIWSNFAAGDSITALIADTYTVTATDGNGCSSAAAVVITEPTNGLNASISTVSNVSCNGESTGELLASATGGSGSLAYQWSNGNFGPSQNNLSAATYTVTITDGNGCTDVASATVTQPTSPLAVFVAGSNVLCFGANTGVINATPSGGTNPLSYTWNSGSTVDSASNLAAGTYTVTLTDGNGCTAEASTTITQPSTAVTVNITNSIDLLCFGQSTGSLTSAASGGTGSLSYLWSNSSTGATASGLMGGSYTVTVSDANSCTATTTGIVQEPALLTVSVNTTPLNCDYDSTAVATAAVSGGTGPYGYQWSTSANTQVITSLSEGNYIVTVTDVNGCTAFDNDSIIALSGITATLDSLRNANCFGEANGSLEATASNGFGNYTYAWSNGASTSLADLLAAGTYTVSVTDDAGCIDVLSATVSEPTELIAILTATDESCMGNNDGSIATTVSGSVAPYEYAWDDALSQITPSAMGLAPGSYEVTITDAQGCSLMTTDTVEDGNPLPQPMLGPDTTVTNGSALTLNPGNFASYLWSDGSTLATLDATVTGTYAVLVMDANGCEGNDTIEVTIYPTGITSLADQEITLFPNPTRDQIWFTGIAPTDEPILGQVRDSKGQIVSEFELNEDMELSLAELAGGTYSILIFDRGFVKTFRVVVL